MRLGHTFHDVVLDKERVRRGHFERRSHQDGLVYPLAHIFGIFMHARIVALDIKLLRENGKTSQTSHCIRHINVKHVFMDAQKTQSIYEIEPFGRSRSEVIRGIMGPNCVI